MYRLLRLYHGLLLLIASLAVVLMTSTFSASVQDYTKTPVLFVHGHGLSPKDWQQIIAHLITVGYPQEYLYAVDIVPNVMGNVRAASTVIAPAVELLLTRAGGAARHAGYGGKVSPRVDMISHSMGVVSSRWYAAKLHPERVRTWIALAGANHGTNALCPYNDEAAREMCPAFATNTAQSAVQVNLNGTAQAPLDETPYGLGTDRVGILRIPPDSARSIAYFTVRVEPDAWIKPEHSAVLDGAGGVPVKIPSELPVNETSFGNYLFQGREGFFRKPVDHCSLLNHPDLLRLVTILLATRHGR